MSQALKQRFIGAVEDEWQLFSDNADDYELGPHIGFGASSTVYHAMYKPTQTPCAIKVVDLDKLPQSALHLLRRETQLMSLSKHPNVLRVRGSWTDEHRLSIAFRLMNAGSAADVMRYAWPGGMNEEVVKCILKQALEGLQYVSHRIFSLKSNPLNKSTPVTSTSTASSTETSRPLIYSSMTMALFYSVTWGSQPTSSTTKTTLETQTPTTVVRSPLNPLTRSPRGPARSHRWHLQ